MSSSSSVARTLLAPLALVLFARAAVAQDGPLVGRLDKPTYAAVTAIVDSARSARLPTNPLVDKALEGTAKGSSGPNIVFAVHTLFVRMGSAKHALGANTTPDEIKSAAGAIESGVSVHDLARLRAASGKRQVTMPLAVLTDLIGRSVPVPTATDVVVQLARSGVKDEQFSLFQRNVDADIKNGADATAAATTRARGLVMRGNAPPPPTKPSE